MTVSNGHCPYPSISVFLPKVDHSLGATPLEGGQVHGRQVVEGGRAGGGSHPSLSLEEGGPTSLMGRRSPVTEVDTDGQFCSINDSQTIVADSQTIISDC